MSHFTVSASTDCKGRPKTRLRISCDAARATFSSLERTNDAILASASGTYCRASSRISPAPFGRPEGLGAVDEDGAWEGSKEGGVLRRPPYPVSQSRQHPAHLHGLPRPL